MSDHYFNEQFFVDSFLDYFNNYLTIDVYAQRHGISKILAREIIRHGKRIHESRVEAEKLLSEFKKENEQ